MITEFAAEPILIAADRRQKRASLMAVATAWLRAAAGGWCGRRAIPIRGCRGLHF